MDQEIREVVRKIRDVVLTAPKKWTQGVNARTESGNVCHPEDTKATCWCLNGAAIKATSGDRLYLEVVAHLSMFYRRQRKADFGNVVAWNDEGSTRYEDVKNFLDAFLAQE